VNKVRYLQAMWTLMQRIMPRFAQDPGKRAQLHGQKDREEMPLELIGGSTRPNPLEAPASASSVIKAQQFFERIHVGEPGLLASRVHINPSFLRGSWLFLAQLEPEAKILVGLRI
jgi:hypothetical protein